MCPGSATQSQSRGISLALLLSGRETLGRWLNHSEPQRRGSTSKDLLRQLWVCSKDFPGSIRTRNVSPHHVLVGGHPNLLLKATGLWLSWWSSG